MSTKVKYYCLTIDKVFLLIKYTKIYKASKVLVSMLISKTFTKKFTTCYLCNIGHGRLA